MAKKFDPYAGKIKGGDAGTLMMEDNPDDEIPFFGPGYYHFNTPGDDSFIAHNDIRDVYIYDFDNQPTLVGNDTTNVWESGLDVMFPINDAIGAPDPISGAYTGQAVLSGGPNMHITGNYQYEHINYDSQTQVVTTVAQLGTFNSAYWTEL